MGRSKGTWATTAHAAAVPREDYTKLCFNDGCSHPCWPRWVELQTALRASCLAPLVWALLWQSHQHARICQAERALKSQKGSGGLLGNTELPRCSDRLGFRQESDLSNLYQLECTWKAIKNLPPTSVTWHPQTADSHPCACFELIHVFKIIPFHQSNISLALSFPAADSHPVPALSYTLINILAIEIIFPFCPPHATDSHTDPSFKPQLIHNLCLK